MATVTQPIILDSTGQGIITALNAIEDAIENSGGGGGGSSVVLDDVGTASSTTCRYQRLTINGISYEIRGTKHMEQSVTLSTSANVSVTFASDEILSNSVVDVYCDVFEDISPAKVQVSAGSCIVTFYAHNTALVFNCRIYIK